MAMTTASSATGSSSAAQPWYQKMLGGMDFNSIGLGIGDLLGSGKNPADAASPYLNQIRGQIEKYLTPYINSGQGAMNILQNQYGDLLNNPGGVVNNIGKNFQQSPGFQFQVNQALGAANRAASAGGMAGSPQEQQGIASTVNDLANQDYYNWLGNAEGMFNQGLQGEQGINQMGFDASNNIASLIAQALSAQAQNAYAGQANKNQNQGGGLGSLIGGIASGIGKFL